MAYKEGKDLKAFDVRLADYNMRGQWTADARRDQGVGGTWHGDVWETAPPSDAHLWNWDKVEPLLVASTEALPETLTARRSLIFNNPSLPFGTTNAMVMGIQMIMPGELAWAHRHTISALRFVIEGHPDLFTVVEGDVCPMETNDLVLTPNWHWHDHHNNSPNRAVWLDVLDGPLVAALKQTLFENYGEDQQPVRNQAPDDDMRYPWADMAARLDAMGDGDASVHDGYAIEYTNPKTGGSVMPTLGCGINELPAGFEGAPHRHSSSAVYFVVSGAGQTRVGDVTLDWGPRDSFTVPAWAIHSHINASKNEPATLFTVSEAPALRALGLYREDPAPNGSGTS